jgi:hypothetical protein
MGNALRQSRLRVLWASVKLDELGAAIEAASTGEPITPNPHPSVQDRVDQYFAFRAQIHNDAARLVSEFVLHIRAALDYVVFLLAWRDSGHQQDRTQFPIDRTPERFAESRRRHLKHLTAAHAAMIERFQPYDKLQSQSLLLLQSLSNMDKHRELIQQNTVGSISPDRTEFRILLPDGSDILEGLAGIRAQVAQIIDHFDRELQ